ncbi:MAG: imidazoleglycerol-phosphate dehydratase HisB [Balneolaceae bacterium]
MNIWIDQTALAGEDTDLLRPGALYGLRRLIDLSHEVNFDPAELSPQQQRLIGNEGLSPSGSNRENSDALLSLNPKGGELELRTGGTPSATGTNWPELIQNYLFPVRKASGKRTTSETDCKISLNIDGTGKSSIRTGLNFFDHMLEQIARHGLIDLELTCSGDLQVDEHHTIEDVAILLGETIYEACGRDKTGIQRYGFLLPMDEARAEVSIDLSNRPYLVWDVSFGREYVGDFPLEMAEHFFHTLAMNLKATLQIRAEGTNEHHKIESIFKGFARALRFAVTRTERARHILPSSKGTL